jgi:putative PIG3 family NAD(P)H quinone oxidoreductase
MINARAIQIVGKGDVSVLRLGETPVRDPGPGELLVEVAAAGLNRADIIQRKGFYPAPPGVVADVPGLEYAGTVAAIGDGVAAFSVGDKVMGIVAGGAMATHLVVHEREAIPVPTNISLIDAAAIPEVFLTAFDALFAQASVTMGQNVLLHAIGSGVGSAALQLVNSVGAVAIGTARSQAKLDACKSLGLIHGIVVKEARFADALREITNGRMADTVLDTIGAAYLSENIASLASRGTIVVVGLLGGASAELSLALLLAKRARVIGTVLRSRPLEEKATLTQHFIREALPLFETGKLKPVIDVVLPMDQIAQAHTRMEASENVGKIVLRW